MTSLLRATTYRALRFWVSSWRNAFAGHGTGNELRSTSWTASMSSRVMSSMTTGATETMAIFLSRPLRKPERRVVRRRRRERLREAPAHRGLADVDRLERPERRLLALGELVPPELGEVAGAAHPRRGSREQRERAEEVAQRGLPLLVDLADEERVRPDLPAEIRDRSDDERRTPGPLAVALLIERGVVLAAAGGQEGAGTELR